MRVVMWTASTQRYGIETSHVVEVVPIVAARPLDKVGPWVRGLMRFRGRLVPLLDAGPLLDGPPVADQRATRILALRLDPDDDATLLGLIVERVLGVGTLDFADPAGHPGLETRDGAFLGPVAMDGDTTVQLVRPDTLLDPEQQELLFRRARQATP